MPAHARSRLMCRKETERLGQTILNVPNVQSGPPAILAGGFVAKFRFIAPHPHPCHVCGPECNKCLAVPARASAGPGRSWARRSRRGQTGGRERDIQGGTHEHPRAGPEQEPDERRGNRPHPERPAPGHCRDGGHGSNSRRRVRARFGACADCCATRPRKQAYLRVLC
jgi:hypothetical protein